MVVISDPSTLIVCLCVCVRVCLLFRRHSVWLSWQHCSGRGWASGQAKIPTPASLSLTWNPGDNESLRRMQCAEKDIYTSIFYIIFNANNSSSNSTAPAAQIAQNRTDCHYIYWSKALWYTNKYKYLYESNLVVWSVADLKTFPLLIFLVIAIQTPLLYTG